jgi:hypothetical protein
VGGSENGRYAAHILDQHELVEVDLVAGTVSELGRGRQWSGRDDGTAALAIGGDVLNAPENRIFFRELLARPRPDFESGTSTIFVALGTRCSDDQRA